MNIVDLILLIGFLWVVVKGWRLGLLRSLAGLLSIVLAYGFALSYGGVAAAWIAGAGSEPGAGAALLGFCCVFLLTLLACYLCARILHNLLEATPFGLFNAIGGALFGLAQGLLILGLALILLRAHPIHSRIPDHIDGSAFGRPVQRAALALLDAVRAGFPRGEKLYRKLVPPRPKGPPHPIVDKVTEEAEGVRSKLDGLIEDTRKRLDSEGK